MELTATALPTPRFGRHRRYLSSQRDVANVWARRTQPFAECRAGMTCLDGVAYSGTKKIGRLAFVKGTGRLVGLFSSTLMGHPLAGRHAWRFKSAIWRGKRSGEIGEDVPIFDVPDPMGDDAEAHRSNLAWLERQAEETAWCAKRSFIDNRKSVAKYAVDDRLVKVAFAYGRVVGFSELPDESIPYGALADWLREYRPGLTALAECAACLCPLTGGELSGKGARGRKWRSS